MHTTESPLVILLVEDNPGDVRLIKEALKHTPVPILPYVVSNGVDALAFLQHKGDYTEVPRPSLILLDLNIPQKHGLEVLSEIKSDKRLLQIPVVVLTASNSEEDIHRAYRLHANSYVVKPANLEELSDVVRVINTFWGHIARLPKTQRAVK